MTTTNNLDALFADAEPPFGHPGPGSTTPQNTPTEPDYTPDEEDSVIHYAPDDHPLCGTESLTAVFTDDPATVAGCVDCLELAAEDLDEDNEHWANCLHCQQEISAQSGVEWRASSVRPARTAGRRGGKSATTHDPQSSRAGVDAESLSFEYTRGRLLPRAGSDEDLEDHCFHYPRSLPALTAAEITSQLGGRGAWRRTVRKPCPHCEKQRW